MSTVDVLKATKSLSRLVKALESGAESEIILSRDGKPAARLVPMGEQVVAAAKPSKRITKTNT